MSGKKITKSGNQVDVGIFQRILESSKWIFELTGPGPDQIPTPSVPKKKK